MKKLLFFFLSIISLSFATDEFVKGLIDKFMEKGSSAWWWDKRWWEVYKKLREIDKGKAKELLDIIYGV